MENTSDNLSMPERMKRAKNLREQYGSEIPQDLLDEINYISIEGEDGQLTLMTAELFAKKSLEKKMTSEINKPPFDTVSFSVDVSSEIGARVPKDMLHAKIEDTYLKIGYMYYDGSGNFNSYPYQSTIAERYPQLAQFASRFDIERSRIAAQHLNLPRPTSEDVVNDTDQIGNDMLTGIAENICHSVETDMTDYADKYSIWWKTDGNHVPPEAAQRILTINQHSRSKLTDVSELKRHVQPAFERETVFPGLDATDEEGEQLLLPADVTGWDISRQTLSNLLREDDFSTIAETIERAETFDDVVSIVDASVKTNERVRQLKQEQKDLQSSTIDPHERFAKLSQIKSQIKSAHQTMTSLQQLLRFNQVYAEYAGTALNSLDETLTHKVSKGSLVVELDARPDKKRDANPGKMSGDCTEDKPLPFGSEPGLANIKVSIDGEYVGNIYSYQTTSDDSRSVWHLDAIQIPNRAINWQTFPDKFIQTLEPFARENGIDIITINSKQYEISNYDYVAKGFMQYLRADTAAVEYDNMEQPATAGNIDGKHIQTVEIKFPKMDSTEHHSELQGAQSHQIVLWENDKRSR